MQHRVLGGPQLGRRPTDVLRESVERDAQVHGYCRELRNVVQCNVLSLVHSGHGISRAGGAGIAGLILLGLSLVVAVLAKALNRQLKMNKVFAIAAVK